MTSDATFDCVRPHEALACRQTGDPQAEWCRGCREWADAAGMNEAPPVPALDAGGGAAFVDAVDALVIEVDEWATHRSGGNSDPRAVAAKSGMVAARAALLAAHASAVLAADAAGYARAMGEVARAAAPFTFCHDPKPPNGTARCCDYYHDERDGDCNGCKLWRALGGDAFEDAPTPPALVNGGPPTDGLDDGR